MSNTAKQPRVIKAAKEANASGAAVTCKPGAAALEGAGPGPIHSNAAARGFAPQTFRQMELLAPILILAALVAAYYPAIRGGFLWDDNTYISENPTLLTLAGLRAIWADPSATCQYYPLSFTVFWTIHHFFGLTPLAFHLATLMLHGAAAILFWKLLDRLRVRGALLAAAIFALHPLNVMSVAWMTELKNTLSCSLALGAAWAYVRFAGLGVYEQRKSRRWPWYLLSLILFQLAMLAKTAVSFLPVSLLLILWWQRERITRRDLLSLAPMVAISLGMGALTIEIERHAGGASGGIFTIGFLDRALISTRSFWFYLGKVLWPSPLIFIYPRWTVDAGVWWQWLFPAATVAALGAAWMSRRRVGKGLFVALMHFYVSTSMLVLFVVLYMMRYSFVADHWAYFGALSIIALIASGVTRLMDRLRQPWRRNLEIGAGIALLLVLGAMTRAQSAMYLNRETLWRTTIARNPGCWMAETNLGVGLSQEGRIDEALVYCREAVRLIPGDDMVHFYLGNVLLAKGSMGEAIAEYRKSLSINADSAPAHANLGVALARAGRREEAIAEYREALRLNPADAAAQYNLGKALLQGGQIAEAIAQFRKALDLDPSNATIENTLAWMLAAAPQDSLRDGAGAIELATRANQAAGGGNPVALRTLAAAYAQAGRHSDAVQTAQKALELAQAGSVLAGALAREIKLYQTGHAYEQNH